MQKDLKDEIQIIKLCQEGDLNAFEKIYRQYQKPLYNFAFRMLGSHEDAEDAMQVTFLKLYRGISGFKFKAKFSSYLMSILIRVCYDSLNKRKQGAAELNENITSFKPVNDLAMDLEKAILLLPLRMRECFILFAVQGYDQSAIADILKISIGSVKAHIFQAKQKLRRILSDPLKEVTT